MKRIRHATTAFAAGLLAIALQAAPAAAQGGQKVTIGLIGITSSVWPTLVADKKGYFTEFGVAADFVTTGSSAKSVQQAAAGAVDVGSSSLLDTVRAVDSGAGVKVVANGLDISMHTLVAAKDVKTVAALKGKRVIVGGSKDVTAVWWADMARNFGIDPEKDVELLFAGSTGNRFAALVSGGVSAAVLAPPASFKAAEQGYTDLGPVASFTKGMPYLVFHANAAWAARNKAALVGFVRAHNKAIAFLYDTANRDEAARILAQAANVDATEATRAYDLVVQIKAFEPASMVTDAGVVHAAGILKQFGEIAAPKAASAYLDRSFAEAARAP